VFGNSIAAVMPNLAQCAVHSSRVRFRLQLDADNRRWVLFLFAVTGLSEFGAGLLNAADGTDFGPVVILVFVFATIAPLMAVVSALLVAPFLLWTGRWLGGRATTRDLHAALAWAMLPLAVCAPLVLADLFLACRQALAITTAEASTLARWRTFADPVVRIALLVAALWSGARYVIYLSEAQRFSKWRAVGNQLVAALVFLAAVAGVAAVVNAAS
jgi:hypothetical protein